MLAYPLVNRLDRTSDPDLLYIYLRIMTNILKIAYQPPLLRLKRTSKFPLPTPCLRCSSSSSESLPHRRVVIFSVLCFLCHARIPSCNVNKEPGHLSATALYLSMPSNCLSTSRVDGIFISLLAEIKHYQVTLVSQRVTCVTFKANKLHIHSVMKLSVIS